MRMHMHMMLYAACVYHVLMHLCALCMLLRWMYAALVTYHRMHPCNARCNARYGMPRQVCTALAAHWHAPAVVMPCLEALEDVVAAAAARRGLLVAADLREMHALLHQVAASGAPGDELLRRRVGCIFHSMQTSGLLADGRAPRKKR